MMKKVKINDYEYLEYSYRTGDNFHKIRKKVNEELDLEKLKLELLMEIFRTRWGKDIKKLGENYKDQFCSLPKPIQGKNLHNFGVQFTHNTNKIEGSSLSLKDVVEIINDGVTPSHKPLKDVFEAKKHMDLYEQICHEPFEISWDRVLNWHKILFHETKHSIAGTFRDYPVGIAGSKYTPPMGLAIIEIELERLLKFWRKNKKRLHPVLLACLMHLRFVTIHPFGDGNGRISRLLMNFILYHSNFPMFDIPAKYRRTYYNALERSNLKNDESVFLQWFMRNYLKVNKKYL